MSGRRKSASFLGEAAFGFIISVAAAVLGSTLTFAIPADGVVRGLIAALAAAYLLRALGRSRDTTGRVVVVALWLVAAASIWLAGVPLTAYAAVHVGMLWLARSLYTYGRPLEAALDLGLTVLSVCFAVWAAVNTGSLFLASWCFFLLQAMHVAIPVTAAKLGSRRGEEDRSENADAGFAEALAAADEALHRIAARR